MEHRLSQACMAGHDFYQGVRSAPIDKDKNPRRTPATPEDVSQAAVEAHFAPPPWGDLTFPVGETVD